MRAIDCQVVEKLSAFIKNRIRRYMTIKAFAAVRKSIVKYEKMTISISWVSKKKINKNVPVRKEVRKVICATFNGFIKLNVLLKRTLKFKVFG